jgi:hypothetical protein
LGVETGVWIVCADYESLLMHLEKFTCDAAGFDHVDLGGRLRGGW